MKFLYEYEYDGIISDGEFKSIEEAQAWADMWWAEYCTETESPRNGESFDADIKIICYEFNNGDVKEILRIPSVVEYTHYHGDFAEHNTWR